MYSAYITNALHYLFILIYWHHSISLSLTNTHTGVTNVVTVGLRNELQITTWHNRNTRKIKDIKLCKQLYKVIKSVKKNTKINFFWYYYQYYYYYYYYYYNCNFYLESICISTVDKRLCLQVCLFLCPDITMLLASIIWFVIEGISSGLYLQWIQHRLYNLIQFCLKNWT